VIKFDASTHTYRVDGKVIPSVTQIITAAGLRGDFKVSAEVMAYAGERGKAVHMACELHDHGELDEDSVHPAVAGYLAAYRKFLAECDCTIVSIESAGFSETHNYCGTPDRLCEINGAKAVIDLKSGIKLAATGVQLAAYANMVGWPLAARYGLHLSAEGRYQLIPYTNPRDWPTFLAALTIHRWRQENGLG
jgi:hypothetical protein